MTDAQTTETSPLAAPTGSDAKVDNCLSDEIVEAIRSRLQAIKMPRVRLERREIEWEEVARESALYAGEIWRLLDACGVGPPPSPGMRAPRAEPTAEELECQRLKSLNYKNRTRHVSVGNYGSHQNDESSHREQ